MKQAKSISVLEQIKKQIKEQIDEEEGEVQELIFTKLDIPQFTPDINRLLSKYKELISLEFTECGLKTLEGFPGSEKIIKLCFEENELDGKALIYIAQNFPELQFLSLSNNKITAIEDLEPLYKLKKLIQLDLQENDVAKHSDYKTSLFENCKALEILDNKDKSGKEVQYSDEDDDEVDDAEVDDESYTDDDEEDFDNDEEEEDEKPIKKKKK